MNEYSLGIIAKTFAKSSQQYNYLSFDNSAITLSNSNSSVNYSYEEILGNISIEEGLIWSALKWNTNNNEKIKFDWINKQAARELQNAVNQIIDSFYKKYFSEASKVIIDSFRKLESLFKKDSYLRYSNTQQWLEDNSKLKGILIREERAKYLDNNTNIYADKLHKFCLNPEVARSERNNYFVQSKCVSHKKYFDNIESNPLTESQRRACVEDEDANLVLAGAGTGKTSTMVGKAGYLIESGLAKPEEILMLAFARKAADEMQERINKRIGGEGLTVKTFHSIGKEIIAKVEGKQPSLTKMAEDDSLRIKFVDDVLTELIKVDTYRLKLFNYYSNYLYPVKNIFDFKSKNEYIEYCQQVELRTLNGDLVKSHEELMIANYLYQQGIRYEYEADYIIDTSGPDYRKYKPDFYLPDYGIYIEHFAINEEGETPAFIDQKKYLAGMKWKRSIHTEHGTSLIETYSFQHRQGRLLEKLENKLLAAGVIFNPLPQNIILEIIKELGKTTSFSQLIADFLKLFKSAFLTIKELYEKAANHVDKTRMRVIVELFEPIYEKYQSFLASRNEIDFEDMISKSIEYIEKGLFQSPYRYILVDEFQDISAARARLIKGLKNQNRHNSLFCVGDDWQSIYRFTGSDVALTRNFSDHFGVSAINILDLTFRFNQRIGKVAAKFIQNNPAQIRKDIKSLRNVNNNAITLIPSKSDANGLDLALAELSKNANTGSTVLVLGRFWFVMPDGFSKLAGRYPKLNIEYMTTHAAKGKEADYVIILGLISGKNGFPSSKVSNSILSLLLPPEEDYQYAEERRLFYVALTRARHHVYLVTHPVNASEFIRELRKEKNLITELIVGLPVNATWGNEIPCPECQTGYLVQKTNSTNGKKFYSCNNYPYCEYNQNGCQQCGGPQKNESTHMRCISDGCDCIEPLCPQCGGILKLISGKYGEFWGCNHYRKNGPFSCEYKAKNID